MAVAAAIGKYLTGQTLTSDQAGIVAAAQGFFGNPPQGAPPISTTTPSGNGSGGGGTGNKPPKSFLTHGTVHEAGTLQQIAKRRGWDAAFTRLVEALNNYTARTRLKKGQRFVMPSGNPRTYRMPSA